MDEIDAAGLTPSIVRRIPDTRNRAAFASMCQFARNAVAFVGASGATGVFGPPARLRKSVLGFNARPNTSHVFAITDNDNYVIDVESGAIVHERAQAFNISFDTNEYTFFRPLAAFAVDGAMCAVTNEEWELSLLDSRREYARIASLASYDHDALMSATFAENKVAAVGRHHCILWDLRCLSRPLFTRNNPKTIHQSPTAVELVGDTLVINAGNIHDDTKYDVLYMNMDPKAAEHPIMFRVQHSPVSGMFDGGTTLVTNARLKGCIGHTSVFTYHDERDDDSLIEELRIVIHEFNSNQTFRHADGTLYMFGESGIARVSPNWTCEIVSREDFSRKLCVMVDRTVVCINGARMLRKFVVA